MSTLVLQAAIVAAFLDPCQAETVSAELQPATTAGCVISADGVALGYSLFRSHSGASGQPEKVAA